MVAQKATRELVVLVKEAEGLIVIVEEPKELVEEPEELVVLAVPNCHLLL